MVFLFLTLQLLFQSFNGDIVQDNDDDEDNNPSTKRRMINFASYQAGAVVIDKSPPNGKGFNNLLNDDRDKYAICSAHERKWVVIGLSEEVAISSVAIANYEKYSSTVREFQLLGSLKYPTNEWNDLGTYTAQLMLGEQSFSITNHVGSHTRYLKIKIISHYLDEELFTLSQIKVYGQTVFVSLQEEVARSDETSIKLLLQDVRDDLLREDLVLSNESGDGKLASTLEGDTPIAIEDEVHSIPNGGLDDTEHNQQENVIDDRVLSCADGTECNLESEELGDSLQQDANVLSESTIEPDASNAHHASDVTNLHSDESGNHANRVSIEALSDLEKAENGAHLDISIHTEDSETLTLDDNQFEEEKNDDENITVEHETSGQVERLRFNRTEWDIVSGALQRSNLTVDFLKTTIQSIKQFFVDPLSQKLDMHNLERFISTQVLPVSQKDTHNSETEELSTEIDSSTGVISDAGLETDNHANANIVVKESTGVDKPTSLLDNQLEPLSDTDSIQDGHDNGTSISHDAIETSDTRSAHQENQSVESIESLDREASDNPPSIFSNATNTTLVETELQENTNSSSSESVDASTISTAIQEEENGAEHHEIAPESGVSSPLSASIHEHTAALDGSPSQNSEANVATVSTDDQAAVSTSSSLGSEQALADSVRSAGPVPLSNAPAASSNTSTSQPSVATTPLPTGGKLHSTSWSSCLDQLKFSDFQARMMAKLHNKNASSDSLSGSSNNASSAQNDLTQSSNNNNIFKQIIQRMKNLEANQAISDIYLSQLSDCLRIIREEMHERQQHQDEFNLLSQQNPLNALFTLPLTAIQNQSRSSQNGAAGSSASNSAMLTIPLLASFTKGSTPLDAFWTQMFQFLRALIRIMWRFVWIVVLSGRQEQGLLLTNTLQELRTLLQTSVVEFWCALVCGLVVSLLFGLFVTMSILIWMLVWCCCGGNRVHHREKEFALDKRRYLQRQG